jgi:hypothetical protein
MPTTLPGLRSRKTGPAQAKAKSVMLLVFSVGGRRMAALASDVSGIWPWSDVVPVPSGTPHISAVLKRGEDILPVFDWAIECAGQRCRALVFDREAKGRSDGRVHRWRHSHAAIDQRGKHPSRRLEGFGCDWNVSNRSRRVTGVFIGPFGAQCDEISRRRERRILCQKFS